MGYGVPAAIAAKIVEPERTVVCFAGDGDFLMSGQELATAVHEGADRALPRRRQRDLRDDPHAPGARVPWACGRHEPHEPRLRGLRGGVRRPRRAWSSAPRTSRRARRALAADRAALLHLRVDPDAIAPNTTLTAVRQGTVAARENGDRMRSLSAIALAVARPRPAAGRTTPTRPAARARRRRPAATTDSFTITELPPTTPPDTTPEGEGACSTSGLRLTLPEQDLPPAVADVRKRVFDAAIACDYDTLEQIALEQGEGFTFSYGARHGRIRALARPRGEQRPSSRSRCARSRRS